MDTIKKRKRLALLKIKRQSPGLFKDAGLTFNIHSVINGPQKSYDKENALSIFYLNRGLEKEGRIKSLKRILSSPENSIRSNSRKRIARRILEELEKI